MAKDKWAIVEREREAVEVGADGEMRERDGLCTYKGCAHNCGWLGIFSIKCVPVVWLSQHDASTPEREVFRSLIAPVKLRSCYLYVLRY